MTEHVISQPADRGDKAVKWLINLMVLVVPPAVSTAFYWPVSTPKLFLLLFFAAALVLATAGCAVGSYVTHHLHSAALAFGLAVVVSALVSGAPVAAFFGKFGRFEGVLAIVVYLVIFLAASQVKWRRDDLLKLTTFMTLAGLLVGTYGVLQYLGLDPISWPNVMFADRVFSTYGNPALLTAYLVIVLPGAAILSLENKPWPRLLGAGAVCAITMAIMTSYTRSGWLALAVSFTLLVILVESKHRRRLIAIIFLGLVLSALLMTKGSGPEAGQTRPTERLLSTTNIHSGSVRERLVVWKQAVRLIGGRPILGFGPGNFGHAYLANEPQEVLRSRGYQSAYPDDAHNHFLELLATTGLLGFSAYMVFIVLIIKTALSMRRQKGDKAALFGAAATAAVAGYLINAFFQVTEPESGFLLWLLAGIVAGTVSGRRHSPRTAKAMLPAVLLSLLLGVSALSLLVGDHLFLRGVRKWGSGDLRAAEMNLGSASRANPLMAEYQVKTAEVYYLLSVETGDNQYLNSSLSALNSAQTLDPLDHRIPARKGHIYFELGRRVDAGFFPLALSSTEQALALRPFDAFAYLVSGEVLLEQGQARAAVAQLEKARLVWPESPEVHENLGLALTNLGDPKGARRAFARAAFYRRSE